MNYMKKSIPSVGNNDQGLCDPSRMMPMKVKDSRLSSPLDTIFMTAMKNVEVPYTIMLEKDYYTPEPWCLKDEEVSVDNTTNITQLNEIEMSQTEELTSPIEDNINIDTNQEMDLEPEREVHAMTTQFARSVLGDFMVPPRKKRVRCADLSPQRPLTDSQSFQKGMSDCWYKVRKNLRPNAYKRAIANDAARYVAGLKTKFD